MKKFLLVLVLILFIFAGCNSFDVEDIAFTDAAESDDIEEYPFNSTTIVDDLEWIGRVLESEDSPPIYELVKVDKEGNETVMYENKLDSLYPSISLKSDQGVGINNLVLEHYQGYPEGGSTNVVSFNYGEEFVEARYGHFWGFVKQFSFRYPDTNGYQVEIETSGECSDYPDRTDLSTVVETNILGLKIISVDDTESSFPLPSSKSAPCDIVDGYIYPPVLKNDDIQLGYSGISIKLPGGIKAYISRDDSSKEIRVSY